MYYGERIALGIGVDFETACSVRTAWEEANGKKF